MTQSLNISFNNSLNLGISLQFIDLPQSFPLISAICVMFACFIIGIYFFSSIDFRLMRKCFPTHIAGIEFVVVTFTTVTTADKANGTLTFC